MSADRTTVVLTRPVPNELADELARRIYFVSPEISGFDLVESGGAVCAVRLRLDRPADPEQLRRKLDLVVESDVLAQRRPVPARVWTSAATTRPASPVFPDLVAAGAASPAGDGRVILAGPMLILIDRLDGLLRDLAVEHFAAVPVRYPTLLATADLLRSGYLKSFPQHAMFATRLHADLDAYRAFQAGVTRGDEIDGLVLGLSRTVEHCLPPTMCYHTFAHYAGQTLDAPATVTSQGPSFRHESRYQTDLERLCDFTIREIVFLGDKEGVAEQRRRFLDQAVALFDELRLTGYAEVANDPFFADAGTAEAVSAQLMLALKYEARLYVSPDRTVAVGSFNVHDQTFTRPFGIGLNGGAAASACVGFGLERLAYAVACQHGLDQARWPEPLRGTLRGGQT